MHVIYKHLSYAAKFVRILTTSLSFTFERVCICVIGEYLWLFWCIRGQLVIWCFIFVSFIVLDVLVEL